jgi:hypothetical protein
VRYAAAFVLGLIVGACLVYGLLVAFLDGDEE